MMPFWFYHARKHSATSFVYTDIIGPFSIDSAFFGRQWCFIKFICSWLWLCIVDYDKSMAVGTGGGAISLIPQFFANPILS